MHGIAVEEDPYTLRDVLDMYKTQGTCKEAVKEDPETLRYCHVRYNNPRDVWRSYREKSLSAGICFSIKARLQEGKWGTLGIVICSRLLQNAKKDVVWGPW